MAAQLAGQLIDMVKSLAQGNALIALAVVISLAALGGLLLATVLRLLRALLPWLVIAGAIALCWQVGLLDQGLSWVAGLCGLVTK